MTAYKTHPLAELFPIMSGSEMTKFVADIKQNGLKFPIVLFEGKILDGRHRYEACEIAEVKPRFEQFKGDDAFGFVLSSNLHRRHLTESQRAMVAAKIADLKPGQQPKSKSANLRPSHAEAAKTLSVSERSVDTASKVLDESPRLAKQVAAGKISLHAAAEEIKESKKLESEQLDKIGFPIPEKILPMWNRGEEVQALLTSISRIKGVLNEAQDGKDKMFSEVNFSSAISGLERAFGEVKTAKPFAVCTTCNGKNSDKCAFCKGKGFLSEFRWNTMVSKEAKKMRENICSK